jgi:hypothetical protein
VRGRVWFVCVWRVAAAAVVAWRCVDSVWLLAVARRRETKAAVTHCDSERCVPVKSETKRENVNAYQGALRHSDYPETSCASRPCCRVREREGFASYARSCVDRAETFVLGRIIDLLPSADAERKYPDAAVIDRSRSILLPGFVNAHTHSPMTLFR